MARPTPASMEPSAAILDIASFPRLFDPVLEAAMAAKTDSLHQYGLDPFLADIMAHPGNIVLSGGKRVRPYVALLMYRAGQGADYLKALETLVSLEVFHSFCLMHDDIIDRGMERHGVPTMHVYASAKLAQKRRRGDIQHLGEGFALLLGDLMFAWSNEIFNSSQLLSERLSAARPIFSKMINEVVIGQLIDVDVMTRDTVPDSLIERKMRLKTASYTFVKPMQIGLRLATDDENLNRFSQEFGMSLGLGFQIQDDMLDIISSPDKTTKTLFADLREHQHTFFTQYIFDRGTASERKYLRSIFGADISLDQRQEVLNLFGESGALEAGRTTIKNHFDRAEECLDGIDLDETVKGQLGSLVRFIRNRTS